MAFEDEGTAAVVSPDGRHVYFNTAYGTLAMARDADTGGLTFLGHTGTGGAKAMEMSADGRFLYVGPSRIGPTYRPAAPPVRAFRRDENTGALTRIAVTSSRRAFVSQDIALSPDGSQLFLSAQYSEGEGGSDVKGVMVFDRDAGGTLSGPSALLPSSGSTLGVALAMSADGRFLHAGKELYSRSPTGALSPVPEYSCMACFDTTILLNPANDRLFTGPTAPVVHVRDPATGLLTGGGFSGRYGSGFHGQAPGNGMALAGDALYGVDTHEGVLFQNRVTPDGGLEQRRLYRNGLDGVTGIDDARSVTVSPDGRHAYVVATSDQSDGQGTLNTTVAVFRRDADTGDLTFTSLYTAPRVPEDNLPGVPETGIVINEGAAYTDSRDVTVRLMSDNFGGEPIDLSNDRAFGPGTRSFPLTQSLTYRWRLGAATSSKKPRTVYARGLPGWERFVTFSAKIVLDQLAPKVLSARRPRGQKRRLRVGARDRISGVARVQLTGDRRRPGRWRRYSPVVRYRVEPGRAFVRVRDRAGNRSHWRVVKPASKRDARR